MKINSRPNVSLSVSHYFRGTCGEGLENDNIFVSYYTKVVWQEAVVIYTSQSHSISAVLYESFYSKISLWVTGSKFVPG